MFQKFWLLIWKNMLLRRRHWIITTFEVLLPTLCAGILAYSNKKLFADIGESNIAELGSLNSNEGPSIKLISEHIYQATKEDALFRKLREVTMCPYSNPCPYAPYNKHTREVMKEMQQILQYNNVAVEFEGKVSEQAIEDMVVERALQSNREVFGAAIIFESGFPVSGNRRDGTVAYKIRLQYKYAASTGSTKFGKKIMPVDDTEKLFPEDVLDPQTPEGIEQKQSYINSGFIGLQFVLDRALINVWTGKTVQGDQLEIQPFPVAAHAKRDEQLTVSYIFHSMALPTFLVLGFIFIIPSIMLGVVSERETGIRELLKMNGVPGWLQWCGWLVNSLIIQILSVSIVIVLLFIDIIKFGDPGVWYLILILYMISASTFTFFISSFFIRPILATIVGIILWLVSYFPVFAIFELYTAKVTFTHRIWACMSPNVAFYQAVKIMMTYERDGVGVQWENIVTPLTPGHRFSLLYIIVMFLANSTLYMVLTFYLENVLATEFGVRRAWYYVFLPSTWGIKCPQRKSKVTPRKTNSVVADANENLTTPFEEEPNMPVGIRLQNLRKVYDQARVAVDDITLNMYKGEIFVLLGHNGAGKTTTISMLTGMCASSGGKAEIDGLDISQHLEKVRRNLGLCPQQNMLFDKLTVHEHLNFFGRLKGLRGRGVNLQLQELMTKLEFLDKRNTLAQYLSGGQKRKLHLAIALVGKAKVAILDEPTSGMDAEGRRALWDYLLEIRGARTILLTTHFMEEADVLGDRMAIMAYGKIQCCGTSSFLKKYYGTGYTLKLSLATNQSEHPSSASIAIAVSSHNRIETVNSEQVQEILSLIQKHVPDAYLKKTQSANAAEIFITLPNASATSAALTSIFSELAKGKDKLGIKTVGMSQTTVDEVFLKVGELSHTTGFSDDDIEEPVTSIVNRRSLPVSKLIMMQFTALLLKKVLYTYRKRKLIFAQIVVPVILLIGAILSCNGFFAPLGHPKPVFISLDAYDQPLVPVFTQGDQNAEQIIKSVVGSPYVGSVGSAVVDSLLTIGKQSLVQYNNRYIVAVATAFTGPSQKIKVFYNTVPNHAAPLAMNIASNVILKQLEPNANLRIQVTNHPFRTDMRLIVGTTRPVIEHIFYSTILFEVFMPIGLALLAATFIVLPMEEKLSKAKQLQMMTILNPVLYWGSAFLWDFFIVIIVICMMICCFPIFQGHEMYTSYGGGWVAFLILFVYGYCAIFFSYLNSHFASTVHGGFAFVTIIHIISGLVIGIVVSALDMMVVFNPESSIRTTLQLIGRLFPTYGAVISTTRYVEAAIDNGRCNIVTPKVKKMICDNFVNILESRSRLADWEFIECCEKCELFVLAWRLGASKGRSLYSVGPACFEPKPYIQWETPRESLKQTTIQLPGIAQELTYMFLMSLVYQLLLYAMEYRHGIRKATELFMNRVLKRKKVANAVQIEYDDEDVATEAQRIDALSKHGQYNEDALVVHHLRKHFGKFSAVQQVDFGVHYGECFGLLGVNGAGKTTTFRMLTGDETPSSGVIYAGTKGLDNERTKYLSSIGYCPQFDGIIGVLSGREMLQLFCSLRGIPKDMRDKEADRWLKKLGLSESSKVTCMKYSGGMRRRLCAAIAMIGDPPIILLDEPTSGVDPVSRRQFWKVMRSLRDSGQAIILTSHSMEECEILCSRLGIMVNGQLQCLGGVQHLKSKFAQGYSLSLKMKPNISVDSEKFQPLNDQIMERFEPCSVKDKHNNFIQYGIHNASLSWDVLFRTMEEMKSSHEELIEDYAVSETTLEEVFLSFARKQYGGRVQNNTWSCFH